MLSQIIGVAVPHAGDSAGTFSLNMFGLVGQDAGAAAEDERAATPPPSHTRIRIKAAHSGTAALKGLVDDLDPGSAGGSGGSGAAVDTLEDDDLWDLVDG